MPNSRSRFTRGMSPKLNFALTPLPHAASLAIEGGAAGTSVLLDGAAVGTLQADGKFRFPTVSPGDHVIELRRDRFNPKTLHKRFAAGATVTVSGSEAAMDSATGQLKVTFSPADAVVTLAKDGEAPTNIVSGTPVICGARDLSTDGSRGELSPLGSAGSGRGRIPYDWPSVSRTQAACRTFADAAGWKSNQGWFVHRGGGFVLYNVSFDRGNASYSAPCSTKGHRLQWVFNYTDDRNYELFQMDENYFYRSASARR